MEEIKKILDTINERQCKTCEVGNNCPIFETIIRHPGTASQLDIDWFVAEGYCRFDPAMKQG